MFLIQNVLHKTSSSFIQAVARTLRGQRFQGTSKRLETIKQACDDSGRGSIMRVESGHETVCACASADTRLVTANNNIRLVVCSYCDFYII